MSGHYYTLQNKPFFIFHIMPSFIPILLHFLGEAKDVWQGIEFTGQHALFLFFLFEGGRYRD